MSQDSLLLSLLLILFLCDKIQTKNLKHTCDPKPLGYTSDKIRCTSYYHISNSTYTFEKAFSYCSKGSGFMAYLKTKAERQAVTDLIILAFGDRFIEWYIGARNDGNTTNYHLRWLDGTRPVDFLDPDEVLLDKTNMLKYPLPFCVVLNVKTFMLSPMNCFRENPVVCERCFENDECEEYCTCGSEFYCKNSTNCAAKSGCYRWVKNETFCDLLPCPSFRYGKGCENQCICKDWVACNQQTGKCPDSKCQGQWGGSTCNFQTTGNCPIGRYSKSPYACDGDCICANDQACTADQGICLLGCNNRAGDGDCMIRTDCSIPSLDCGLFSDLDKGDKDENHSMIYTPDRRRPCKRPICLECSSDSKSCLACNESYAVNKDNLCEKCSPHCGGRGTCERTTLKCVHGCKTHFQGDRCDVKASGSQAKRDSWDKPSTVLVITLAILALIALTVFPALVVVVYKMNKNEQQEEEKSAATEGSSAEASTVVSSSETIEMYELDEPDEETILSGSVAVSN